MLGSLNVGKKENIILLPPGDIVNLRVKAGNGKLTLTWEDPEAENWVGTKVVYKTTGYPTGPDDGTLAANSEVRNYYSENGLEITNLVNGETYYIQLFPYANENNINTNMVNRVTGVPQKIEIYGIKRSLTTESSAWERTDDASGLVANARVGYTEAQNDFDSIYPWSAIYTYSWNPTTNEEIRYDASGFSYTNDYIFTKIPEFWYKRWRDDDYEYIQIAGSEAEDFIKSEEFSVARYLASGELSKLTSKSGAAPLTNYTRANFRSAAKKLAGCCLIDWRYFILQILYLVEYADYNSQAKLGKGYSSSTANSALTNGSCDILGMKSGMSNSNNGWCGVIYRGVENIYGNLIQYVDGINSYNRRIYICIDPTKYADNKYGGDYFTLAYTTASPYGWASKLGYDANHPLFTFPTDITGSRTTHTCDFFYTGSGVASVGGRYGWGSQNGLFYWRLDSAETSYSIVDGSRLLRYE